MLRHRLRRGRSRLCRRHGGRVVERFGAVHVLHNNAATKGSRLEDFFAPYEDVTLQSWREIMAVNLDGMFLVSQAIGRQMIRQRSGGSIVQTASIYGVLGPTSASMKARTISGARSIRRRSMPPRRRRSSALAAISRPIGRARHPRQHADARRHRERPERGVSGALWRRVPLGRMGAADELVAALIFLASDASSYVTGQTSSSMAGSARGEAPDRAHALRIHRAQRRSRPLRGRGGALLRAPGLDYRYLKVFRTYQRITPPASSPIGASSFARRPGRPARLRAGRVQ